MLFKRYILSFLILFISIFTFSQSKNIDSLLSLLEIQKKDTNRVNTLINAADHFKSADAPRSLLYADEALSISSALKFDRGIIKGLLRKAYALAAIGKFDESFSVLEKAKIVIDSKKHYYFNAEYYFRKALIEVSANKHHEAVLDFNEAENYYLKNNNYASAGECKITQARLNFKLFNYEEAINNCYKAIEYATKSGNKITTGSSYLTLGTVFEKQKNYGKALENYEKALEFYKQAKSNYNVSGAYLCIGNVYLYKKEYEEAKKYYQLSLDLKSGTGDKLMICSLSQNLGNVLFLLNDIEGAYSYYQKGYQIALDIENSYLISGSLNNIGTTEITLKKYDSAEVHLKKALLIAQKNEFKEWEADAFNNLSKLYFTTEKYKEAYLYKDSAVVLKDSIFNKEQIKQALDLEEKFQNNKKNAELKIQELNLTLKDKELERNKWQKIIIGGVLGLVLFFFLILFSRFRLIKKQKRIIAEQKLEVESQKDALQEKQQEILDSISYAKRLQQAILIPEETIKKRFSDCFVLYKPKDIVSGDFYWFAESNLNKIIAVADCTGHGVPGGFMSMMGYEMLQDVLLKENITTTSDALKALDIRMTESLNKSERTFRDGMDIALCAFSKHSQQLQYTGANRPLIHISNNQLKEYTPDKNTIGGDIDGYNKTYTKHLISYQPGDVFYIFTDGYADQFGGSSGKKFKYKQLKELLLQIHQEPLSVQKDKLNTAYQNWKGLLDQVDDVCIVGIKI